MSTVTNIRAVASGLPEVVGYVEALTTDRILGWAWAPASPESRAAIELRLGDAVIASTAADLPRADLVSSGIGDGRHAYDIAIPPDVRSRAAELHVFARVGDGEAFPIGATPAADGLSHQVTKLLRGVDMLVNSHRVIHRNLQTALTGTQGTDEEPVSAALARMAELQAGTEAQLSAMEKFVIRLDEHLSRLSPADMKSPDKSRVVPRAAIWALTVSGIALFVSIAGLVRSLGG
jgi:hypothetical protein